MEAGQIVMIYSDPFWMRYPEGQAKLIEKIGDFDNLSEFWNVEFIDCPGKLFKRLIHDR